MWAVEIETWPRVPPTLRRIDSRSRFSRMSPARQAVRARRTQAARHAYAQIIEDAGDRLSAATTENRPPAPLWVVVCLLREPIKDVDEFAESFAALVLALRHAVRHAAFDVMTEYAEADTVERGFGSRKLLKNLDAEPRFLHHPANAPDLALNPIEAGD